MINMDSLITKFVNEEIRLDRKDISESARSREWFLEKLSKKIAEKNNEPILYKDREFTYFGSYFKGTKVSNVDEYDVLVVIDSNHGEFRQNSQVTGKGIGYADPNHKYDEKFKKSDLSGVSPTKLLNWLKNIIDEVVESYGGETPIKDGQAITVYISSKDVNIELVPAGIFERISDRKIFFNIPKGDKNNGWILTNPLEDQKLLESVAEGKDNFKNIIRILKYIKDKEQYNMAISSFAIECQVINYVEANGWDSSVYNNLLNALSGFYDALENGEIVDTFNDINLLEGVESIEYYSSRIKKIFKELCEIENGNDFDEAYKKLYKVMSND